jgi:hypothetical protein
MGLMRLPISVLLTSVMCACHTDPIMQTTTKSTTTESSFGHSDSGHNSNFESGTVNVITETGSEITKNTSSSLETSTSASSMTTSMDTSCESPEISSFEPCNIWHPGCPPCTKCIPYRQEENNPFSFGCAPVGGKIQVGLPCFADGGIGHGLDNCEDNSICWAADGQGTEGVCVALCLGAPESPTCEDANTLCYSSELPLCLEKCNPLNDPCDATDTTCIPHWYGGFICVADAPETAGGIYDECSYQNECLESSGCFPSTASLLCNSEANSCCLAYCDLSAPDLLCDPDIGEKCISFYEFYGSRPPAGYENVGFCRAM